MNKIENILIKALRNPETNFFTKYKVSRKNEQLIREAFDISKKYGKKTTRSQAIKRGYKSKLVLKKNNYKSLLGS